jgi:hypothetical protein
MGVWVRCYEMYSYNPVPSFHSDCSRQVVHVKSDHMSPGRNRWDEYGMRLQRYE